MNTKELSALDHEARAVLACPGPVRETGLSKTLAGYLRRVIAELRAVRKANELERVRHARELAEAREETAQALERAARLHRCLYGSGGKP